MDSAATTVKNILLRERCLNFSDEWFEACIDWIKENHPPSQINVKFLRDEVSTQWMDANLTELGCSCLPASLVSQKCLTLNGSYALQVNIIEDIGESSYSQWNKLKKVANENTNISAVESNESKSSWEPKPRRCLFLTMTDGTQEVFGLELVIVPALSVDLKPGTKVLISGPVECRGGVLHLKPGNIRILGGEVEAMSDNAYEHVLQRRLNQQTEARVELPRPTYKRSGSGVSKTQKQIHISQSSQVSLHSRNTQPVSWKPPTPVNYKVPSTESRGFPSNSVQEHEPDPFGDDDEDFMDIDETLILSQAQQSDATTVLVPSSQVPTTFTQVSQSHHQTADPVMVDLVDDEDDEDFIVAEASHKVSAVPKETPNVSIAPYQYIKTIKERLRSLLIGEVIYVKACVATLVSNISTCEGQWTLTVSINDGSGFLEAKMNSELLNRIIGFSYAEMKKLKTDPCNRNKINQGLAQLTSTLVHMNGIFGVAIHGSSPMISTFHDIQNSHVDSLRNRVSQFS